MKTKTITVTVEIPGQPETIYDFEIDATKAASVKAVRDKIDSALRGVEHPARIDLLVSH